MLAQPRLPGGISAAVRSSFERSADELDRSLLGPLDLDGQRLVLVSTGSGLTVFMTQSWQLLLFWGVFVGVGPGGHVMVQQKRRPVKATPLQLRR